MRDIVEHTGKAFLGLTMNCAHCHDHKYDPIKHEEYFALRAVFEPLELRHDPATRTGALRRVGAQLGINPETLRNWVT